MSRRFLTLVLVLFGLACQDAATEQPVAPSSSTITPSASGPCFEPNEDFVGASYDLARSRFAFGSTPVQTSAGAMTRWQGAEGSVAIWDNGYASGRLNSGASAANRPDWSADVTLLITHVREYFIAMGVPQCQMGEASVFGSISMSGPTDGSSTTVSAGAREIRFSRALDGIPILESHVSAQINDADQSTSETFFWPTIPGAVVGQALTFRNDLKDPVKLAAFKTKLPAEAQGEGRVVIHHTLLGSATLKTAVSWDTFVSSSDASYDINGKLMPYGSW